MTYIPEPTNWFVGVHKSWYRNKGASATVSHWVKPLILWVLCFFHCDWQLVCSTSHRKLFINLGPGFTVDNRLQKVKTDQGRKSILFSSWMKDWLLADENFLVDTYEESNRLSLKITLCTQLTHTWVCIYRAVFR